MSEKHLYLSLIPQALVASMLPPEEFGTYYAVGTQVHVAGEAMFFEVDPAWRSDDFPFELMDERCVAHPDGSPKSSVYLSIYQVLARVPVAALGKLYLVTNDGRTLGLERSEVVPDMHQQLHLYQEFCPVTPMVASRLEPRQFGRFITDPDQPVSVPRIVYSELKLGELATDPENGSAADLPYPNIQHLRDVLLELMVDGSKNSKMVLKQVKQGVLYRTVRSGFYVADASEVAYYRFPTVEELEADHHEWWRSAQVSLLG